MHLQAALMEEEANTWKWMDSQESKEYYESQATV